MFGESGVPRRGGTVVLASVCATVALLTIGGSAASAATPSRTEAVHPLNGLPAVSCVPEATDCAVQDSRGNALYSTDVSASSPATWTAWAGPKSPSEAITCPSTSLCVLADGHVEERTLEEGIGGDMYYATSFGGAWTEAFEPAWGVLAASCPSSSFCVAAPEAGGDILQARARREKRAVSEIACTALREYVERANWPASSGTVELPLRRSPP